MGLHLVQLQTGCWRDVQSKKLKYWFFSGPALASARAGISSIEQTSTHHLHGGLNRHSSIVLDRHFGSGYHNISRFTYPPVEEKYPDILTHANEFGRIGGKPVKHSECVGIRVKKGLDMK